MPPRDISQLLADLRVGDRDALEQLMPVVYAELRQLAAHYLRRERSAHTLQPTALVHEMYVRLAGARRPAWRGLGGSRALLRHRRACHAPGAGGLCAGRRRRQARRRTRA